MTTTTDNLGPVTAAIAAARGVLTRAIARERAAASCATAPERSVAQKSTDVKGVIKRHNTTNETVQINAGGVCGRPPATQQESRR